MIDPAIHAFKARLVAETAARYTPCGRFSRGFAAGKLRWDPLFFGLLAGARWPDPLRLVDLGCGRGLLINLLITARRIADGGGWPRAMPAPPRIAAAMGLDRDASALRDAARSAGSGARFVSADLATAEIPAGNTVLLADVLHYLDERAQTQLLERAVRALEPGGVLLIRDVDTGRRAGAWAARVAERIRSAGRLRPAHPFHYRSSEEWASLAAGLGCCVESASLDGGTPFANSLLQARTASGSGTAPGPEV